MTVGGAWGRPAALVVALLAVLLTACTPPAAPAPAPPPPTAAPQPSQLVVAVDDLGAGFNPHLLAHQSPVTTALAGLVLPSVFRPDADGVLQLDRTVATSAQVDRPGPVHGQLRAEPRGVVDEQRPDRRRGLRLPLGADARRAGCRGRRRLPADHRRPLAGRRQGRRRRVLPALPGLADAVLRPAAGAPAQGRARLVDRRAGQRAARVGRPVPRRVRRPRPRRDPAHPQRPVLGHPGRPRPARAAPAGRHRAGRRPGRRRRRHRAARRPTTTVRTALGGLQPAAADPDRAAARRHRARAAHRRRPARRRPRPAGPRGRSSTATPCAPPSPPTRWPPTPSRSPPPSPATPAPRRGPPVPTADARCSPRPAGPAATTAGGRTRGSPVRLVVGAAAERPADVAVAENVAAQLDAAGIDTTVVAPTGVELFGQATVPPIPPPTTQRPDHRPDDGDAPRRPRPPEAHRRRRRGHDRPPPRPPPRRPPRGSASTSWSGRAPSAATPAPSSRPTTAATTPSPRAARPPARRCPPPAPRRCSRCSTSCSPTPTAARGADPGGRREAAVVAGPGAAAVPAGLAAGEHRRRGRRHRRRAGPADHRSAHRRPALDRTRALTRPGVTPGSVSVARQASPPTAWSATPGRERRDGRSR